LSFLADATIIFNDRRCADVLLPEAEFFAGLNLMSSDFLAAFGSAHRALAGLTALLDRPGVEDHFAAALEMDTRMGSICTSRRRARNGRHGCVDHTPRPRGWTSRRSRPGTSLSGTGWCA
jgi:hypothetical protein